MRRQRAAFFGIFGATCAVIFACGSRTGLLVPEEQPPEADAARDVGVDAARDVYHPLDVSFDQLPMIDSTPHPDVERNCPDAAATLIYVITFQNVLYSFYPPSAQFTPIGTIACPAAPGETPFSMAVDREGIARVLFSDGELFRVSTATAACEPTSWIPQPSGSPFFNFGMAYVTDDVGGGETLYIASDSSNGGTPSQLASIDSNYVLHSVGTFDPQLHDSELTGTGDGRLFGFDAVSNCDPTSSLVQIDKTTAAVEATSPLANVQQGSGWAFGFWGGDFYFFTAPIPEQECMAGAGTEGPSIVQRYDPSTQEITQVATLQDTIVGAGVSTCAPED